MKLSSHDFLFHRIINMRNTKVNSLNHPSHEKKNKKYISDVKNKIVELHKIESGCKKRVKTLKIPISTIRLIIKRFQSTKDVKNLPERGRVYIVLMHAEEESLSGQRLSKDHSWRIAEISWVLGSEPKKKKIKHPLYHHMLFGRVSRKILLTHPKTNSSKFSCQTRLELQMALASMVRWNWKMSFLAANPPDEFSTNRDKKVPHVHG